MTPAGAEGGLVDRRRRSEVKAPHRACHAVGAAGTVDRRPDAAIAEVGPQQDEPIGDLEPGSRESLGCPGEQGGAANRRRGWISGGDRVQPAAQLVDLRQQRVVAEADVDNRAAVGRRAHHQGSQGAGAGEETHATSHGTGAIDRGSSVGDR